MKTQRPLLSITAALVAATLGADAPGAQESSTVLSPQALQEIAQVQAEIDRIEAQAIERLAVPPDNQVQQVELLGKLMLYDKQLSVNRNEACAFCYTPETGFTGPVSELNRTTGSYPGSVRTRFSSRKPQSHAYAPLSPVLHYNPGQGDLVGGNFWDMRATGRRLGNPAAEQAQGPPTKPGGNGPPRYRVLRLSRLATTLSGHVRKRMGTAGLRYRLAERGGAGLRPAGTAADWRPAASPSRAGRSRPGRHYLRSDGAIHRRL
jgi:cytochrome c peroxidase